MSSAGFDYALLQRYTKALSVALGYRDLLTRLHSDRVSGLCEEIAVAIDMAHADLIILNIASAFHDIGKIGIPDHILFKPSKLDDSEWKKMKEHSVIGQNIMVSTELNGSDQASILIRHHHEHYNGGGYPDGLSNNKIPVAARIISIADSYDAMAVTRSYHKARTHTEVMNILHSETGAKHDPELMAIFSQVIEKSKFKAENI